MSKFKELCTPLRKFMYFQSFYDSDFYNQHGEMRKGFAHRVYINNPIRETLIKYELHVRSRRSCTDNIIYHVLFSNK